MNINIKSTLLAVILSATTYPLFADSNILVFQSDFGLKDGAVSTMKGVSASVDKNLKIYDITHEIPAYNIWDAAYS